MRRLGSLLSAAVLLSPVLCSADARAKRGPREALLPFNDLIGSWRCTGTPAGPREEAQKNFWIETMSWQWQFKDKDAWLAVSFTNGKYYTGGELTYEPAKDRYQLKLRTAGGQNETYSGTLKERVLTLTREGAQAKDPERFVFQLLHSNRIVYSKEVRPEGRKSFRGLYQIGATKKDVPFAGDDDRPECVVSGGLGTMKVTYKDETFFVCCSGCRTEFNANPEQYVKAYKEKLAKKKAAAGGQ
jgi:hypothetical protein